MNYRKVLWPAFAGIVFVFLIAGSNFLIAAFGHESKSQAMSKTISESNSVSATSLAIALLFSEMIVAVVAIALLGISIIQSQINFFEFTKWYWNLRHAGMDFAVAIMILIGSLILELIWVTIVRFFIKGPTGDVSGFALPDGSHTNLLLRLTYPLLLVIMAPLMEEILFRVVIFQGLASVVRIRYAIVISALVFAAAHLQPTLSATITTLPVIFVLGLVMAYRFWKYQRFSANWFVHIAINTLPAISLMLQK